MRIVIIGSGGFIGTNLTMYFIANQYEVICCDIFEPINKIESAKYYTIYNPGMYTEILEQDDVVLYLSCKNIPATSNQSLTFGIEENILEAVKFFDICIKRKVKKIVFSSSGGAIYGKTGKAPINERQITTPISSYGIQKLAIEKYLELFQQLYPIEVVSLRISNPYGPWQRPFRGQGVISTYLASAISSNQQIIDIWGDGEEVRDYLFITDLMDAFEKAIYYHGESRVINIGSGVGNSLNFVIKEIESVANKAIEKNYLPQNTSEVKYNILDYALASEQLGWYPKIDLKKGIRLLAECWNEQNRNFEANMSFYGKTMEG